MIVNVWYESQEGEVSFKDIKNVKYVNFLKDYVIIETKSGHTEEIDLNLIMFIKED